METLKFKIELNLEIDPQGVAPRSIQNGLFRFFRHAIDNGLLTGETLATVESYDFEIAQVKDYDRECLTMVKL